MNFIKSKGFILLIIVIILIAIMVISSNPESSMHGLYKVVSVPLQPVVKFFNNIADWVSDTIYIIGHSTEIEDEYNRYKEENDRLKEEIRNLERYKQENEELRELLDFKEVYEDYKFVAANLIAHDVNNWYDVFSIDKGTKDGVKLYDPVVTSKGLVGKIVDVSYNSAKVMAIIDESSTVMGRVTKTKDLVRIRGTSSIKYKGLCQMDRISELADIAVGDIIETAASGGVYPKGIVIGKVKEINIVAGEGNKYAIIEPVVDFGRLEKVIVLSSKNDAANTNGEE